VISENQSTFVPGRLITEKDILAFACLHNMEHGAKANNSYKLDLSKAYDRVELVFLENAMHKMGFSVDNVVRDHFFILSKTKRSLIGSFHSY
jgi:hypothetical protein